MIIQTRKCDVCGVRHDNDHPGYDTYGQFTTLNGQRLDVCADCGMRLLEPLAPGYVKTCEGGC